MLIERDITKAQMRKDLGFSTGTMSKMNKGNEVSMSGLLKICKCLDCDIGDIRSVARTADNKS